MTRAFKIVVTLVLAAAIVSCSRVFFVEARGTLESGVDFEFRKSPNGDRSRHRIRELRVYQEPVSPEVPPVWSLEGSASVHTISYGDAPHGLSEAVAAVPLQAGEVYFVLALDKPLFNSVPGSATSYFTVARSGEVRSCRREECTAVAAAP